MSTQGPLARSVRDARLALQVMAQGDPRDTRWADAPLVGPAPARPIRVALLPEVPGGFTHPAQAEAVRQAGRHLAAAGYVVEEVAPPEVEAVVAVWHRIGSTDVLGTLAPNMEKFGDDDGKTSLRLWLELSPPSDLPTFLAALAQRDLLLRRWQTFFMRHPVIVAPTLCDLPPPHGQDLTKDGQQRLLDSLRVSFLAPALGLPGLAVPVGTHGTAAGDGGAEILAGRFREDLLPGRRRGDRGGGRGGGGDRTAGVRRRSGRVGRLDRSNARGPATARPAGAGADTQHHGYLPRTGPHGCRVETADRLAYLGKPDRLRPVAHYLRRRPQALPLAGRMELRGVALARSSVVMGSTVAYESSASRSERITTAGRALSRGSRTSTTVPRQAASGATAIPPPAPRAVRNRPPWHLPRGSAAPADGTHRQGGRDRRGRSRPAATARRAAIRVPAGRCDGERSDRGRRRELPCVTRNAPLRPLQVRGAGRRKGGAPIDPLG